MTGMKRWFFHLMLTFILLSLVVSGCYRKGENIPVNPPTANTHLQDAWAAFESGSYAVAAESFTAAKDRDALKSEAYLGLGWTLARQLSFDQAISNFRIMQAISQDAAMLLDSYAGLAVCFAAMKDNENAIEQAEKVLQLSPSYSFSHDTYINAKSMNIIIARSYVDQMDYLSALETVEGQIQAGFTAELLNAGILLQESKESPVVVSPNTPVNGEATLRLTKDKGGVAVPLEIVKVLTIKSADGRVGYGVVSFQQGGGEIIFKGNPIPQATDVMKIDLIYAADYGLFLSKLFEKITSLRSGS